MAYTIRIKDDNIQFSCDDGQSVLDGALRAGYEVPYSCRSGICGSCRGQLLAGEVSGGAGAGVLSDEERGAGHVLLCQARPCSDLEIAVREIHRCDRGAVKTVAAKVYRITHAAPDVTVLLLRFPAGVKVRFRAGQYLRVHLDDGSFRQFSMANPPQQNDGVELHVRHVPGGRFSQRVAAGLAVGDVLEVSLPYGDFFLREETGRPVILLAGGTGFAPVKAIIEDAQRRKLARNMVLYWGARRPEDLYRIELPRKWETQAPWFRFVPVLSETQWEGRSGLVHQAVLDDVPSLAGYEVYACGAPGMINAARQAFVGERGLAADAFHCDAFVPTAGTGAQT
jgi:NAD(P)H-flavin reductase/ferredoxin